jgi:hypothetical protein
MLKSVLADINKTFNKLDMKMVVVHSSDGHLRVSCHTDEKQMYVFVESIDDKWTQKEFAFRDYSVISSLMSSFSDDMVFDIKCNEEDYPNILKIKNKYVNMTHYLQNYTFISRQDDLLNEYKGKKFQLKPVETNLFVNFDKDLMRQIMKLSALTNETLFKIGLENNNLYFYFGDESKTMDNAKICVCENYEGEFKDKGLLFNVNNLNIAFNSLNDQDVKMRYDGGTFVLSGENEISRKVIALVGKK